MRCVEMLLEYHFKIKHVKGLNNAKADVLSWWTELQGIEKLSGAILKLYKDKKIKYNHLKLAATQEYKILKNNWE